MKQKFYFLLMTLFALSFLFNKANAAPAVTLTTSTIAAANINQGTTYNVVYAVNMKVTVSAVTINRIDFTLSGTHDNNDLSYAYVYFNPTSPVISGATYLGNVATTFAGPHAYSVNISKAMAVGDQGYYIIAVNVANNATDNHTIVVNGATNPVVFGYSVATTVTNNQSNKAQAQTIQGADITLTSAALTAADINQGTTYNVVYATKMKVVTEPVSVSQINFTLLGTHDNNDLTYAYVYYNATSPVISGATYLGNAAATYAGPHTYSVNISKAMAVGDQGYFIIAVNIANDATDNHTVLMNGATNPVTFGFVTAPNITNSQTNQSKALTIQAADITLTSATLAAATINQGTTYNVVYATKMKVVTEPVSVSQINFTLLGTHDNNDLTYAYVYYNATSPVISGATYLGNAAATYAGPHTYSVNISKAMAVGDQGYFIIAVNVANNATDNHTILMNGATNPITFGFVTAPNVTNSQANKSKPITIQAADITLTTSKLTAANINQGSTYNVVYATKMKVVTEPVSVSQINFTLLGTHDNGDLTYAYIYFNASAPVISGATYLGNAAATYSAPHDYSVNISKAMAVGDEGYYIIAVNVATNGTDNHTVLMNGATNPITFGFVTAPNLTNSQANKSKKLTIQAADITLTSAVLPAANINQGSTYNVVYATYMKVVTEPVSVNQINFTLLGTHDNGDLTYAYVYFNATAPVISGATYLGNSAATYSGPHDYSVNISKAMAVGDEGYYIIAVNVATNGTDNHTIYMNGATNPITFGFGTAPNVTNSQSNKSQKLTIQAADITLTSATIATGSVAQGSTYNVLYAAKMKVLTEPVSVNQINFTLSGNQDNNDLTYVYVYYNASAPVITGATYLGNSVATYAAPHAYSVNISKAMAVADEGYFIVAVNISPTATIGKTIRINGATDPVVFGFTTAPNITNSQTNSAGVQTIVSSFAKTNDVNKTAIENSFAVNGNKVTDNKISKLYPNPANSFFNFEITGKEQKNVKAQLTNRLGNVVALKNITINKGNNAFTMNVASLINGMYYLVLVTDKGELIDRQQVIIQH